MMLRTIVLCVVVVLTTTAASAQVITDMIPERITEAIQQGQRDDPRAVYDAGRAYFTTPYSRVVLAAANARRAYKTITHADIPSAMLAAELEVFVRPDVKDGYVGRWGPVPPEVNSPTQIVIAPRGNNDPAAAIHPLRVARGQEQYQNLAGATWPAQTLLAWFPLSALTDGNEIRIRYADGRERRERLKTKGVR